MRIYFAGSRQSDHEGQGWYQQIIAELRLHGEVLVGCEAGDDQTTAGYERDIAWLESADYVVAEVTAPSLGVGYALRVTEEHKMPVLCLFNEETECVLSPMVAGNPYLAPQVVRYPGRSIEMVQVYLAKFFR